MNPSEAEPLEAQDLLTTEDSIEASSSETSVSSEVEALPEGEAPPEGEVPPEGDAPPEGEAPPEGSDGSQQVPEDEPEPEESDDAGSGEPGSDDESASEVDLGGEWFVIHSYSGYENKVKSNLGQRIATMGMQDKIFRVVVPTEEEVEIRDGQKKSSRKRVFPGYILVHMILDDESWYVVRNTPGVTGFVGTGPRPVPLRQDEVDKILQRMEAEQPRIRVSFRVGETVRIVEGPFADFMGLVDEIYAERGKVRVLVSFFGRETPVELDFLDVEKI